MSFQDRLHRMRILRRNMGPARIYAPTRRWRPEGRPDVVLLSSEPYPFSAAHIAEVQALAPGARIVLADGEAFSWYGSRLRRTPGVLASLGGHLVG